LRLVLDWDGTVTEVDTLHLVLERFGDLSAYREAEEALGRSLTLNEVIAVEFATVRAALAEVVAFVVENTRIRRGFGELAERHRPLILSSGFHELIEPVLAREGVEPEVVANRIEADPGGWRVRFRDEAACASCGEACKRGALPSGNFAYAGDGYSDRCAALAATRVFARDGLARYLDERGVAYEPFDDLHEVGRALAAA
jgi:2-hydroxy-3-keto-5-methylthiopentenyl-1-phosphate phosphatase